MTNLTPQQIKAAVLREEIFQMLVCNGRQTVGHVHSFVMVSRDTVRLHLEALVKEGRAIRHGKHRYSYEAVIGGGPTLPGWPE